MSGLIELARDAAVARLILSAPKRKNALSVAMWQSITQHMQALRNDAQVRVIVLMGSGADFCAGAHIGEFAQQRYDQASGMRYHEAVIRPALQSILACDKPVIAAIRGHCVGGGLELAACGDLRIADDTAQFGVPVLHRGFPLAPFEMTCVLDAFGRSAVMRLLLEGTIVSAAQALQLQLVHHVVSAQAFDETLGNITTRIAAAAPGAVAQTKQMLRRYTAGAINPGPTAPADPADYAFLNSNDYREGIAAFLEKRRPNFSGT
jgi:enoyl-CoA hydratase/carnithine racemase